MRAPLLSVAIVLALLALLASHVPNALAQAAATGRHESTESQESRQAASRHFRQGVAFYQQGSFDSAVAEFSAAYRIRPHPAVLFNLAQCYERLARYDQAIAVYRRYLRDAGPEAADRAEVEEHVAALDSVLADVEVRTNVERAQIWVDGRLAGTAPGRVRVGAGRHRLELRATGFLPEETQIEVAARERRSVRVELSPGSRTVVRTRGLSPAFFWTTAGVALASAGMGTYFGLHALDLSDAYEADPSRTSAEQRHGRGTALTADVFFVGAGVLAITAGVLLVVTDWGGTPSVEREARSASRRRAMASPLRLAPVAVPAGGGLLVQGTLP